jgi:hypothetical protein
MSALDIGMVDVQRVLLSAPRSLQGVPHRSARL